MSRVAVEVAQTGVDVFRAPAHKKTFSSLAASLPIHKKLLVNTDHVSTPPPSDPVPIYEHGLGYVPLFIPLLETQSSPKQYSMYTQTFPFAFDENFIYHSPLGPSAPTENHLVLIVARPLLQEYTSPVGSQGKNISGVARSAAVLKIARKGKSIDSTDERDAIVDTDFKTLLVHKQGQSVYIPNHDAFYMEFTVNTATDVVTVGDTSSYVNGNTVGVSSTGVLPTPLQSQSSFTDYYVTVLSGTTLKLSTTFENYTNGVYVDFTNTGSGIHSMLAYKAEQGRVEHGLGYPPLFLMYHTYTTGGDVGLWRTIQGLPATETVTGAHRADNNNLYIGGADIEENSFAYVIFKDPYAL